MDHMSNQKLRTPVDRASLEVCKLQCLLCESFCPQVISPGYPHLRVTTATVAVEHAIAIEYAVVIIICDNVIARHEVRSCAVPTSHSQLVDVGLLGSPNLAAIVTTRMKHAQLK
jgi:hypothetical protein